MLSVETVPFTWQVSPDGKVVYRGGPHQQRGAGNSGNPAADYSEGASHVLAVIHEILGHHRAVEQRWSDKKVKLHQRLALRLFQEDVKQVSGSGWVVLAGARVHNEVVEGELIPA